jgi:hypothetical protein
MQIELKEITIRELVKGYRDSNEEGVVGYGGKLNIRPKYQREFVYKDKQRDAVITTINRNFPLNVMYWAVCDDGTIYGDLKTLGPVIRMSETNPRWNGTTPELGSSEAAWW